LVRIVQLVFGSAPKGGLGFREAVEEIIAVRKTTVSEDLVGIGRDSSLGHLDRSFITACSVSRKAS
jgi:hypothetical protein